MFKTETHLHTAEVSVCSLKKAEEMVKGYKNAGYSTIFITDHFQPNTLDSYGDLSWDEKMTLFLCGYYRAKQAGEKIGLVVLPGAEIRFPESVNHYLVYGITKEFLVAHPNLHMMSAERFSKIAHDAGLLIVQAHPYRDGKCFPTPEIIDAVEAYNTNPRHEDNSELTEELARRYSLPMIGGSDAHRDEDIGRGGIETETEIRSTEDFIRLVKANKITLIGKKI